MTSADSTITPVSPSPAALAATARAGRTGIVRQPVGGGTAAPEFRAALGVADDPPQWLPSTASSASSDTPPRPERRQPPQLEISALESDQLYQNRIAVTAAAESAPRSSTSTSSSASSSGRPAAKVFQSASRSYAVAYFSTGAAMSARGENLEVNA